MYALISGIIDLPAYAAAAVLSRQVAALFGPSLIFESFVPLLPLSLTTTDTADRPPVVRRF